MVHKKLNMWGLIPTILVLLYCMYMASCIDNDNKKYLNELHKYEAEKGYIDSNSMEYATIATNMTIPITTQNNNINAK